LRFAIELRRRVKEQLRRMGGVEYARVHLSYINKETREESFVSCKELGSTQLIPDSPLPPGDVFTVLLSATLGRPIGAQFVVLGQMSLHGVLSRVEGLDDKLRVAMDAGAQRVLIPTENSRDFATLPAEVLDKLRIEFYSEPSQAAFKALAE
jgi:predicted ATP-dependent Lon-type protease